MAMLRFRLIHLLILMTVICISIPSYFAYKEYQHRKKLERFKIVCKEMHDVMDALRFPAGPLPVGYTTDPKRLARDKQIQQRTIVLVQESNELRKEIDPQEVEMIISRAWSNETN